MKKSILSMFICLLFTIFTLIFLTDQLLAQKNFEGYLEQTTIRKSSMPMQPPKVTENEKIFYKSGKYKSMNLTTDKDMILRFDKELSWTIDHKNKSYTEMTFAQMQEGMNKMRSAMKDQMKDMSPEQRKAMEKMMGKNLGKMFGGEESSFEITVKRTGKNKTILSYNCEQIFLNLNNEPMMEIWVTDKLSMGNDWLDVYEKMGFMKGKLSDEAKKINGIPLANKITFDMGMGTMESETEVTNVVKTSVSDSEFEVPRDYVKKESGMQFK
jgi:uncharacterized protein YbcI